MWQRVQPRSDATPRSAAVPPHSAHVGSGSGSASGCAEEEAPPALRRPAPEHA